MNHEITWKAGAITAAFLLYAVVALSTAGVADVAKGLSGYQFGWETQLYFWLAAPLLCGIAAACGWRFPYRPFRWAIMIALGQALGVFLFNEAGVHFNLISDALIWGMFISTPLVAPAYLGALLRKFRGQPAAG